MVNFHTVISTKKGTGNGERATVRNELLNVSASSHVAEGLSPPQRAKISGERWCGFKAHTRALSLLRVPC
jgi:hypothetical protein